MTKIRRFPKTITAKVEDGGKDDDYMVCNPGTDMMAHAELGETIKVGIYTLTEIREVSGIATSKTVKQ